MANLAGFLVIAAAVIVTPGPDTALTIRNTLLGGRRGGIFTAIGVAAGQTTWAVATSAGIATLLAASEPVFRTVRLAGAAYLILLGLHTLLETRRARRVSTRPTDAGRSTLLLSASGAVRQGLINNLTNPKMAVFFPALLPQFAPPGDGAFLGLLLLGLLFSAITLVWLTAYAFAIATVGDLFFRPRIRNMLETITGAVLIGLGLQLAMERR
jgi:threonine/homoserine/homoserine lactone efflux protein